MNRNKIRQRMKSGMFLLPSVLGTGLFYLFPFILVVYFSLVDSPVSQRLVWTENYRALMNNDTFLLALRNTVGFCAIAVPAVVLLSLGLAKTFSRLALCARELQSIFLGTYMVPSASVILVVRILFDRNGSINSFLAAWGIEGRDWLHSSSAMFVMLLFYLWKNTGYNMVIFLAALSAVPKELYEVAALEGAKRGQIFWRLEIRYLSSALFFVTVLSLSSAFKMFREIYLLEGPYPHESLYQMQHFMNNTFLNLDYQKACAAAILLLAGILILVLVLYLLEKWMGKDIEE